MTLTLKMPNNKNPPGTAMFETKRTELRKTFLETLTHSVPQVPAGYFHVKTPPPHLTPPITHTSTYPRDWQGRLLRIDSSQLTPQCPTPAGRR